MRTKFALYSAVLLLFVGQLIFAQVSGVVVDSDGFADEGASVKVKGKDVSTTTDADGVFNIDAIVGEDVLEIESSTGDAKWEVNVDSENLGELSGGKIEIEDLVVVGYQNLDPTKITAAVGYVDGEELEQNPQGTLDLLLQGRVAGVNVNIGSGQPGSSGTIILRGRNSFQGEIEPLYVIDGVFSDIDNFTSLNPNDIKTVSVLKDAAATALYGSRGAGGVVQVTTKTGRYNQATKVTYRSLYGFSFAPEANFEVMDSRQLLNLQRDLGTGIGASLTDAEINALANQTNTNWRDVFFRNGLTFSQEVAIQGGGENLTNFTSLNYFKQEGITLGSELQRFSLRQNNDYKEDRFTFSTRLTANFSQSNFVVENNRGNNGGQLDNPFLAPYLALPYFSPYNPDGSVNLRGTLLSGGVNPDGSFGQDANGFLNTPYIILSRQNQDIELEEEIRIIGSLDFNYNITDNLVAGNRFGIDYSQIDSDNYVSPFSIRGQIRPTAGAEFKGSRSAASFKRLQLTNTANIRYSNTFGLHSVGLGGYVEYYKDYRRGNNFTGFGFNPGLPFSFTSLQPGGQTDAEAQYIPNFGGGETDRGLFSIFGVFDYNYDNKYFLQASIRRDGSSFFPDEFEFGTFWSVSGRWNITGEEFLKGSKIINNLALRASYGIVGNQELFLPFGQFNRFTFNNFYNGSQGIDFNAIANNNLKWEETAKANIGVDFALLSNRLTGSIDLYRDETTDALLNRDVTLLSGVQTIPANVGEIVNQGVEVAFTYDLVQAKQRGDLNVSVFANYAYNDNEITSLGTNADGTPIQRLGTFDLGDFVLGVADVVWAGVNPANGNPLYRDLDGNLTERFRAGDLQVLGRGSDPVYQGGFGLNISYKGFELSSLFTYQGRTYRDNGSIAIVEDLALLRFSNMSTTLLDAWEQPGDITNVPRLSAGGLRFASGSRYLEDASFLRMRNITVGYTFYGDDVFTGRKVFDKLRVYAQGQNLLLFSGWRGFDPELNRQSGFFDYPQPRFVSFGVDLTF